MSQVAFAPDVFTWPADEPRLIGSRCTECGAIAFPTKPSCPRCGRPDMERHLLPQRGTLWTWTTQDFLPKEPYASGETLETFRPYGVGLVQLGDEVRVEAPPDRERPVQAPVRHGGRAGDRAVPPRRGWHRGHDLRLPTI